MSDMQERHIPDTVSKEAQELLRAFEDPASLPENPAPDDLEGWKKAWAENEASNKEKNEAVVRHYEPSITRRELGGVPVLDIKPKGWQDNGKVLIFTHGGAYALYSASSSLFSSVPVAHDTGTRVISVDYTLAPVARYEQVTDEVISVFQALLAEGYRSKDIAMYGDSAGGALAAGAVLKMRDQALAFGLSGFEAMPAAVVLWSPWSDITPTGDTYVTLKDAELAYLYDRHLKPAADAYADPQDQKHPYVSPVYGDYTQGFPPTLIQGGTREIFLSNFVRHYQALDCAGQTVKLDLYEGMLHVFQGERPDLPESQLARKKVRDFLQEHLGG